MTITKAARVEDIRTLEALALPQWSELVGSGYYVERFDSNMKRIPVFSVESGDTIRTLGEDEFKSLETTYDDYVAELADSWEKVSVPSEILMAKSSLKERVFLRRVQLQKAWLSWVRSDPFSGPSGLADHFIAVLPEGNRPKALTILDPLFHNSDDATYFESMTVFLNAFASYQEWVEALQPQ